MMGDWNFIEARILANKQNITRGDIRERASLRSIDDAAEGLAPHSNQHLMHILKRGLI
jgi:hypothetical protein